MRKELVRTALLWMTPPQVPELDANSRPVEL